MAIEQEPVTRIEKFLAKIGGQDVSIPTPVTREEQYLAKLAGEDVSVPDPVTRKEQFLKEACENGGGGGGGLEYEEGSFTVDSAVGSHSVTFSNQHSTPPAMITLADATGDLNAKNAPCIWSVINAKDIFGSKLEVNTNTFIGYFQVCYSRTQSAVSPKTTFGSDDPPPFFSSSGFTFDIYSLDAKYFRADRTYKWIAVWMS